MYIVLVVNIPLFSQQNDIHKYINAFIFMYRLLERKKKAQISIVQQLSASNGRSFDMKMCGTIETDIST